MVEAGILIYPFFEVFYRLERAKHRASRKLYTTCLLILKQILDPGSLIYPTRANEFIQ
jgi:hypothetical protein